MSAVANTGRPLLVEDSLARAVQPRFIGLDAGHRGELDRDLIDGGVGQRVVVQLEAEEIDTRVREPAVELVRHLARGVGAEYQRVIDQVGGARGRRAAHVPGEDRDVARGE